MGHRFPVAIAITVFICGCSTQKPMDTASLQPAPMPPSINAKAPMASRNITTTMAHGHCQQFFIFLPCCFYL